VADNVPAVQAATQRLIDAGHRSIAFVGGLSEVETGSERQEGYLAAIEGAGLHQVLANGGFRRDAAHGAVTELLGRAEPVSALVVANNLMALGAMGAVRDAGLRVPEDIAVMGRAARPAADRTGPAHQGDGQPGHRAADAAAARRALPAGPGGTAA